jgi:hypothetical protein
MQDQLPLSQKGSEHFSTDTSFVVDASGDITLKVTDAEWC